MAADLHIHVFSEGELTEEDFRAFFGSHLGSKWFDLGKSIGPDWDGAYRKIGDLPNVWVGEVSWLKAAVLDDKETFVPDPITKVSELITEDYPIVDDELIEKVAEAMQVDNSTSYSVSDDNEVIKFLKENKGKRALTVRW